MAQQIIDTGNVANDGTGESLRSAFTAVNENFTEIYTAGPVGSNVVISGNVITVTGTNNNLELAGNGIGNVQVNSSFAPNIDGVHDIGAPTSRFNTVYGAYFVGNGAGLTGITASPGAFISNGTSNVTVVSAGGNIAIGVQTQSNVAVIGRYNSTFRGNLLPASNVTYDLGAATQAWKDLYLSGNSIYLNNASITSNATALTFTNQAGGTFVLSGAGAAGTNAISNGLTRVAIAAANGNVAINVGSTPNVVIVSGIAVSVAGAVSATGNITGNYFVGNGSLLTGLPATYSNANVAAYLPVYNGLLSGASANIAGNITAAGTVSVGPLLAASATVTGTTVANTVSATAITSAAITTGDLSVTGNVSGALAILGNVSGANLNTVGRVSAAGNITGAYVFGNASQMTGLPEAYSNAKVAAYLPVYTGLLSGSLANLGNLTVNNTASLVTVTATTANLTTLTAGTVTASTVSVTGSVAGNLCVTGNVLAPRISSSGNIVAANVISAQSYLGNASLMTGLPEGYSNAKVAAFLPTYTGILSGAKVEVTGNSIGGNLIAQDRIIAVGNITGNYYFGNASQMSGLPEAYSNAKVAAYLPTYTGALAGNTVSVTGNATAAFYFGNASTMSGLPEAYSNAKVQAVLASYTGPITGVSIQVTGNAIGGNLVSQNAVVAVGNITGAYFFGNASTMSGLPEAYSNAKVETFVNSYLPNYGGNITVSNLTGTGLISTTGNVRGQFIIGDGGFLSNVTAFANVNATQLGNGTTILSVDGVNGNITGQVNGVGNVLLVTTSGISSVGNVTADYFVGNGSLLTGLSTSRIFNGSSSVDISAANANIAMSVGASANVVVVDSANVTVNGNLGVTGQVSAASATVTGNVTAAYVIANASLLTNVPGANVVGNVPSATNATFAQISNQAVSATTANTATTAGTVTANAQPNITSLGTLTSVTISGNVLGGNLLTTGAVSTSGTVTATQLRGDLVGSVFADDSSLIVDAVDNRLFAQTVSATGNVDAAAVNTSTLSMSGNVISAALFESSVSVVGNVQAGNIQTQGQISTTGNVTTAGYFVGNFAGNITGNLTVPGSNTQVLFNNVGNAGASGSFTFADDTKLMTVLGAISAQANVIAGNVVTAGVMSATGNVSGGNVITGGAVSATGNVSGGNVITGGAVSATGAVTATGNVTGSNLVTGGLVTATGNVTGGNVVTGGTVSATGNVTGGNLVSAGNIMALSGNLHVDNILANTYISAAGNIDSGNFFTTGSVSTGTVSASGNITGGNVVTGGIVSAAGNILTTANASAAFFLGNGSQLTGVVATGIGTLASLSVTGNIDTGNLRTAGQVTAAGNVTGGNVSTAGQITATGNITGGNVLTAGLISTTGNVVANLVAALVGNITNLDSLNFSVENISALVGNNGVNIGAGGFNNLLVLPTEVRIQNVPLSVVGNVVSGNIVTGGLISATGNVTGGNVATAGVISATGNVTGGNVATAGVISATGNVTGGNVLTAGIVSATGNITTIGNATAANIGSSGSISATANVTGGNLVTGGTVTATGNVTGGNVVTGGAVTATGNVTAANLLSLAIVSAAGNIVSAQNVIAPTFIGNLQGNIALTGNNTEVLFNDNGVIGHDTGFVFDKTTNALSVGGAIATNNGGNVNVAGQVSAVGNVVGNNMLAGGVVSATGNVTGGNVATAGLVTALGNVTGGNLLTGGLVSAAGNITSFGNIGASFFIGNGNQLTGINAVTVDVTDTNGLTTIYYPTFVENRTTAQIARADVDLTYRTDDNLLTVGNVSVTGNIAGGVITATGNVTAGNLLTAGLITATGNVTAGNLLTTGLITATGNVTAGNLLTTGLITATGNVNCGNVLTAGAVSATGNVTAANLNAANLSLSGNVISNVTVVGNVSVSGDITGNVFYANAAINIAGQPVATVDDAAALAIALG